MGGQSVVPAISGHAEMPLVKVIVEAFMAAYTRPHPASQACSAWTAMPDRLLDDLKEIRSMIQKPSDFKTNLFIDGGYVEAAGEDWRR